MTMQRRLLWLWGGLLLAASAHSAPPALAAADPRCQTASFDCLATKIDEALGRFNDITVFRQDPARREWQLVAGQYAPVTVDDKPVKVYLKNMRSDRPMMLPTRVQGFLGGDGQSSPYSVVGRMPGSNPEVQWVFVVRQYSIKKPTDADFPHSGDMAVIGHHPRTGATTFLQYYDPKNPKSGQVVVSPFSPGASAFWSPLAKIADEFECQRCHNAGPFIHTPWINQVTVRQPGRKAAPAEAIVPSDPLGPYFFVYAAEGEPFAKWNDALIAAKGGGHLDKPANQCTQCHRVAPGLIGLNQNATRYAGLLPAEHNPYSDDSDQFQTLRYRPLRWMPPLDPALVDFYAGQATFAPNWDPTYAASATELNKLEALAQQRQAQPGSPTGPLSADMADVPRPPPAYQSIVVDRPAQDRLVAKEAMWIVDSRMRANTDGDLQQWRFFGKDAASDGVQAAPVVYRRRPGDGGSVAFDVVFVGNPRGRANAGGWVPVQAKQTFRVQQGDYFGVVFMPPAGAGSAIIPYTDDAWARLKRSDGSTWLRDGSVTYHLSAPGAPAAGRRLVFKDAGFRTYSFEFKNRL